MKFANYLPLVALLAGSGSQVKAHQLVDYKPPGTQTISMSSQLSVDAIRQVGDQVADWQLAQFDIRSGQMRFEDRVSGLASGWMYATFDIGLLRYARQTQHLPYIHALANIAKLNNWEIGPRVYHADDQAMGDVYLSLFETGNTYASIDDVQSKLSQVVGNPSDRSLDFRTKQREVIETPLRTFKDPYCTIRWCWADAIFMAPPVFAHLAKVTGDKAYLDFMHQEFKATTDYLFDSDYQLYLRDSRYFDRKDEKGRPIFWGRGNGWTLAGIVRTLEYLPKDFQHRNYYLKLFKALSASVIKYQNEDGSWPSSLLEHKDNARPESSATGLLVFALAAGVNNGWLDKQTYTPVIRNGWQSLVSAVHPDGKVGYVQQVAFAPGSATADDTQLYGSGAVLLAAAELLRMLASTHD
ncbi:glycoside hydrolase family 88/105 protein [Neptunicella marina]|uniref:Glycoside hydrolase family 88 protein n=1 Tax=Neptunicella marina TaxID=2125989 RepID=A0A8J6IU75_9ALTE|nr:glycoside hydrolase family 88 protein [Neptunicella marina]MBC3766771.1 glycoside hydrolase family 88 protein [Neptunicella marina]